MRERRGMTDPRGFEPTVERDEPDDVEQPDRPAEVDDRQPDTGDYEVPAESRSDRNPSASG
jgi:hypothetical protein